MSYLMTYLCYPFNTNLEKRLKTLTPTNNVKFRLLGAMVEFFIIMKFVYYKRIFINLSASKAAFEVIID